MTNTLSSATNGPAAEAVPNLWGAVRDVLSQQSNEPPLVPQLGERLIPLSFSQERLWFICQSHPGTPAYNVPFAWRLRGDVSATALRDSLNAVTQRHKVFQTIFGQTDGKPFQCVVPPERMELKTRDFSSIPAGKVYEALQDWMREEAALPFDLTRLPLFRASLLKLSSREHVLLLVFHHIIFDGWSRQVFFRELKAHYAASLTGTPARLPEPSLQYADYAVWDRKRIETVAPAQLAAWKKRLAAPLPLLDLPLDRSRPGSPAFKGATHHFLLTSKLCQALDELRKQENTTRFVVLLAAFNALLHRYTEQEDFIVGTASANRGRPELRHMIGFFVNTVPLRVQPRPAMSFRELVHHTQEVAFDAFARQDVPFEKIVEAVKPARSLSQSPLFDTMFVLQNASRSDLDLPGIETRPIRVHNGSAKFDLTFELQERAGEIEGVIEFSTDILERRTVQWLARHYQMLLQSALKDPDVALSRLSMLTRREEKLLVRWNDTAAPFPRDLAVHQVFEKNARQTPNAIAMEHGSERWSYAELNTAANAIAGELAGLDVQPGSLVAICAERSPRLIVAMLGVLKAGAAYLPLDPRYPRERLAFMLRDSQAPVLIVEKKLQSLLPPSHARTLLLDAERKPVTAKPAVPVPADGLAYVLYTSGSTGVPKGVCVTHRAINRLVLNTNYVRISSADVVAQAASSSFDAATFEIWGALLNGARLVIIPREIVLSALDLSAELKGRGVSVLFLTTALFNAMARDHPAALNSVKTVIVGGDAIDPNAVRSVLAAGGPQRLLNGYGPTETTTFATCYDTAQLPRGVFSVPIGLPISNTEVHVLTPEGRPAAIGVRGEVFIGGDGLAQGYWNRPDLTAERFVARNVLLPEPFPPLPSHLTPLTALYRTGDFARRLPDGNIEFLGRADNQVKLRGFRVELGEIESNLTEHPAVREAAIIVDGENSDKRLIAYVSARPGQQPSARELRRWLGDRLPDYMVPAHIVFVGALPLNANGKIDRAALPALDDRPEPPIVDLKPWIPLQLQLAQIWRELLGVKEVGLQENFFDLGGHSLLAVQLMDRIEHVCGIKLPVSVFFSASTIEQLSEAILKQQFGAAKPLIEIHPGGQRTPLFFLHGDLLGGGLYCLNLARQLGPQQPFFAMPPAKIDGESVPAIAEMAAEHLRVVRAHRPHGPYVLGGFCIAGLVAMEMAQRLAADGEQVENLILVDPPPPSFMRGVRLSIERLSALTHWSVERQLSALLTAFRRWYRLRELWSADAQEKMRFLSRKLRRQKTLSTPEEMLANAPRDIRAAYLWSAAGYVPPKYSGPTQLFCCDSIMAPLNKKLRAWQRLVPQAEVHIMPGEHLDLVTTHSAKLASTLHLIMR